MPLAGELAQVYPEQFMELMESRALVLANRSIVCRTWAENTRQDQSTPPNLRCRMKPTAIMIKGAPVVDLCMQDNGSSVFCSLGSSKEDPVDLWTRSYAAPQVHPWSIPQVHSKSADTVGESGWWQAQKWGSSLQQRRAR